MKTLVLVLAFLGMAGTASAACKEGRRSIITIHDHDDRSRTEVRTCVNGSYMTPEERAKYIYNPRTTCVEGSKGWVTLYDDNNDHSYTEMRICRNGSYMTDEERAAYVRVPRNRCKEGSRRVETVHDNVNDHSVNVTKVCRAGKWVNARN
ncbi:hypothetical protein QJS83_01110 [Bdellovibrio sp. 22V]|uniref:hypothetical protein n=1 Tax=Bdellovibrio TaxID=958 RepID=UPI0025430F8D|nr:hypothetical protein [Bdellovibrio sp. 22V]WII72466.1 hypothetical protein QJS83_01110 [Bdellovibrio sp. 22V]